MTTPLCILLVDDSPFFLNLCSQFLRNTPASIVTAQCAPDAIAAARENHPNLIYLDLDMPQTDGAACCRSLKSDPELAGIPVIIMGDQADPRARQMAETAGCNGYLAKPLDRREFLQAGHDFLFSIDRREPRQIMHLPVTFTWRGRPQQAVCRDLSTGGMFLVCRPEAIANQVLLLQFALPGGNERLSVRGKIAWVNHAADPRKADYPEGYGVEFVDVPETVGATLRRRLGSS